MNDAALLRILLDEVLAIRNTQAEILKLLRREHSRDDDLQAVALMREIQAAVGDHYLFCSADLISRTDSVALHAAIISACGALSGKRLGQWIKAHEGQAIGDLRIVRTDRVEREGILWQLQVVRV